MSFDFWLRCPASSAPSIRFTGKSPFGEISGQNVYPDSQENDFGLRCYLDGSPKYLTALSAISNVRQR